MISPRDAQIRYERACAEYERAEKARREMREEERKEAEREAFEHALYLFAEAFNTMNVDEQDYINDHLEDFTEYFLERF